MTREERGPRDVGSATEQANRACNEDTVLVDSRINLYAVADGVGGEQAGEVASRLACTTIQLLLRRGETLPRAVQSAHHAVVALAQRKSWRRMASTVAAVAFKGSHFEVAWVGDSRVYLWDGQLNLLTRDHSYSQQLIDEKRLTFATAESHPSQHVITQALGAELPSIQVGNNTGSLAANQTLLVCTDGVSGQVAPETLSQALSQDSSAQVIAKDLVQRSLEGGGQDNASCIVLKGGGPVDEISEPARVYQRFNGERWETVGCEELANHPHSETQRMPAVGRATDRRMWPRMAALVGLGAVLLALLLS